ncbi:OprD family outer membrane porin [Spartinivicinus poritis]|uniref:OprD family outer membrane porin n=1 Tax=Spartinivicinus poritis TaxID=2994640 RepID=A0ABT5UCE6_9GAMM|nr:OprD family outer membrane porin [Spartinivicinus sp. A2-2]MDE1464051.1 OprD family outer membrane porin [Spartinivicinus sp. A2-2]
MNKYFVGTTLCATQLLTIAGAVAESFIDDSKLNLQLRNYYFNRDFRTNGSDEQSYSEEWAQSFFLNYESGYFADFIGVDASIFSTLKLDSGKGTADTGLLLNTDDDDSESYASLGIALLKAKFAETEIKWGRQLTTSPLLYYGDSRAQPQSFKGISIQSNDIKNLTISGGRFTEVKDKASSNFESFSTAGKTTEYGFNGESDSISFVGFDYNLSDTSSISFHTSKYDDIWKQFYYNYNQHFALTDDVALTMDLVHYRTINDGDPNDPNYTDRDNKSSSARFKLSKGGAGVTVAYQTVTGDYLYDYIAESDSIFLANSAQLYDFNNEDERSWQVRFDYDFTGVGIPGLSFMTRYIKGDNIDLDSSISQAAVGISGESSRGEEWERDIEARYTLQSGSLKGMQFRLRLATLRTDYDNNDRDEVRLIVNHSFDLL